MAVTQHGKRVADNTRAEMARRGQTQTSLAIAVDMTQQALSRRLSGRTPFTIDELAKVADVLGVSVTALIGEAAVSA